MKFLEEKAVTGRKKGKKKNTEVAGAEKRPPPPHPSILSLLVLILPGGKEEKRALLRRRSRRGDGGSRGRRRTFSSAASALGCPPPPHLVELHALVAGVAGQEDVVARLDLPGEAHEEAGVDAHGCFFFFRFLKVGVKEEEGLRLKKKNPVLLPFNSLSLFISLSPSLPFTLSNPSHLLSCWER